MKVLFLSHMFPNSQKPFCAPFMLERAKAFSRLVNLKVIAPVSWFPFLKNDLPSLVEEFDGIMIRHPRYLGVPSFLWSFRWVSYFFMCLQLLRKENKHGYILHVEWIYPDAYAASMCAKKYNIRLIGVVHGNEAIEYFGVKRHRKKYVNALKHFDKIIAVSNDLKNKLVNEYHVEENKLSVIFNGVDLKKFPAIDQKNARDRLGINQDKKIAVCVARLSEEKNLDILIRAVSKLSNHELNVHIVGDGPLKRKLTTLIKGLKLSDSVKLVGPVPHNEIYWWLNAADFFCLPSQREGCPVVIHEALACGLPVISTTVGAIPDLVKDDRFGLLCKPDSVTAFTVLMKEAMSRTWDRETILFYGRQFTWDKVAEQTVEVFKTVLNQTGVSG